MDTTDDASSDYTVISDYTAVDAAAHAICAELGETRGRAVRAIVALCRAQGAAWMQERVATALARRAAGELPRVQGGTRTPGGALLAHLREELGVDRLHAIAPGAMGRVDRVIAAQKAARAAKRAATLNDVTSAQIEKDGAALASDAESH